MPTYNAIAFDRLLEPGTSKTMEATKPAPGPRLERRNSTIASKHQRRVSAPIPKLERRNSIAVSTNTLDKKHSWAWISPALYATPEPTSLPDSSSSFPPSPYIVNHKRRGPRLLKSHSEDDVPSSPQALDEKEVTQIGENELSVSAKEATFSGNVPSPINGDVNGSHDRKPESGDLVNGLAQNSQPIRSVAFNVGRQSEPEDYFDPQESMSVKSNSEVESNSGTERLLNHPTAMAEFFDAWEDLSSENAPQPPLHDVEAELREIRLGLLLEIEKRKQAEEALNNMQSQWLKIREQLSLVGLTLPADPITAAKNESMEVDPAKELCQQIYLARFVSNSIGRGIARAEAEIEMEAEIDLKNFEIARLCDRLHYYEAVNREMSQRNQEAVETARRTRQQRKRIRRWIWGSVAAAITFGTAALAWSYFPTGKGSSSIDGAIIPDRGHAAE